MRRGAPGRSPVRDRRSRDCGAAVAAGAAPAKGSNSQRPRIDRQRAAAMTARHSAGVAPDWAASVTSPSSHNTAVA